MQKNITDTTTRDDNELTLVDLDDLRIAFGGEADGAGSPTTIEAAPGKTYMCPSW
ncbi:hypothetical protein [Nannocystis sp. SCPEA4]|uniref:hypothetical protein n=1 Tax=Nannocystis sp. SCPEA4 TaxID=2996787 RepID=UPI00226F685E|nr:hypothetical protein [Nannocystis sp. SCPEA4]MCY1061132.1 hypothetical protein [Nannocystis sp. SCPEA4]